MRRENETVEDSKVVGFKKNTGMIVANLVYCKSKLEGMSFHF